MKKIIQHLKEDYGQNHYQVWGYIKIKKRNLNLWIDNINTLKM